MIRRDWVSGSEQIRAVRAKRVLRVIVNGQRQVASASSTSSTSVASSVLRVLVMSTSGDTNTHKRSFKQWRCCGQLHYHKPSQNEHASACHLQCGNAAINTTLRLFVSCLYHNCTTIIDSCIAVAVPSASGVTPLVTTLSGSSTSTSLCVTHQGK